MQSVVLQSVVSPWLVCEICSLVCGCVFWACASGVRVFLPVFGFGGFRKYLRGEDAYGFSVAAYDDVLAEFALFFEVFAHRRLQRTRAAYGCFREFRRVFFVHGFVRCCMVSYNFASMISRFLFLIVKI